MQTSDGLFCCSAFRAALYGTARATVSSGLPNHGFEHKICRRQRNISRKFDKYTETIHRAAPRRAILSIRPVLGLPCQAPYRARTAQDGTALKRAVFRTVLH